MEFLSALSDMLQYIKPEYIIQSAGPYLLVVLAGIIFAETGLMVGFFLPGDSLLFLVGLYTATGLISVPLVVVLGVLMVAAIVGDQTGYIIGRKLGPALFRKPESRFFKPQYIARTKSFSDRHGGKAIILGRFVPIVRTFVPMIAGVANLEYRKFVSYNVIGGIVWIGSMTLLGYLPVALAGPRLAEQYIKPNVHYITLGIILVSAVPILTTYLSERRRSKAQKGA
ncbi:MAG: DedA family protein [Sphingobacteriia bacterium]